MASGWNLWVWLECIGVVSGCCCREVYRYPHNNYYFPYSTCITVKPPKRGHFVVGPFVLCREVVLSQRFVFKCYRKFGFNRKQSTYLYTISIHTYNNNNW